MGEYTLEWSNAGESPTLTVDGRSIVLTKDIINELLEVINKKASEVVENPFARAPYGKQYYYIDNYGQVDDIVEAAQETDDKYYSNVNYFQNKSIAQQAALHQLLYRKLLKFTYDNDCVDTAKWDGHGQHWFIYYDYDAKKFEAGVTITVQHSLTVYFSTIYAVYLAIKEVVDPFMKEYPEFVW